MEKLNNEIHNEALSAQREGAWLQEEQSRENSEIIKMLECLAPWREKTNGEESIGAWETNMATNMMVKLLELWMTQESRKRIEKILEYYHPLDRAAMAYALVLYAMTGRKMSFKSAVAQQHYMTACEMLGEGTLIKSDYAKVH